MSTGRPKPPRIRDIAEHLGVSVTTVSHALSGKRPVPDETRRRVHEAAARLGYRANPQARALRMGRSLTFGIQMAGAAGDVVLPDAAYFVELLNGAASEALRAGYALVLIPAATPSTQIRQLRVDGAIVVDPTGGEPLLEQTDVPIVTTGRVPGGDGRPPWVDNDFRAGTTSVLEHLAATGRRRPALLAGSRGHSYVADAVDAYEAWCAAHGVAPRIVQVDGHSTEAAGAAAARELLTGGERPDAVHATLDRLAVGALATARDLGVDVPGQLAITAGSDSPALGAQQPPITALDLHPAAVGREAVRLLLRAEDDGEPIAAPVTLDATLRVRASTAAPAGAR